MKFARIVNGLVTDARSESPEGFFTSDIVAEFVIVPDDAGNGDAWDGINLTKKTPPVAVPVDPVAIPAKVSPVEFKLLFTAQERVAIKASTDAVVQDFFEIVDDPRLTHVDLGLKSTQDALGYLTLKGLLAAGRREEILSGDVQ